MPLFLASFSKVYRLLIVSVAFTAAYPAHAIERFPNGLQREVSRADSATVRQTESDSTNNAVANPSKNALEPPMLTASSEADQIFVDLQQAASRNEAERAAQLASQLAAYPLRSYVEYFALKPQLFDSEGRARLTVPDQAILAFLKKYEGRAIADRMRNDYLLVLGARHAWRDFNTQYKNFVLNDDTQVKCYALQARAAHGQDVTKAARALLVRPRQYGDACVGLIHTLAQQGKLSSEDVWQQIRLAYEARRAKTGKQIAQALGTQAPKEALLDKATLQPAVFLSQPIPVKPASHQLALLAVTEMARQDPAAAAALYTSAAPKLAAQEQVIGWAAIAYQAALKQLPNTLDWYRLAGNFPLSDAAYEWRSRAALLTNNWSTVRWAIESMPATLRQQPTWVYWLGRALKETGEPTLAAQKFAQAASRFGFYGQLANEELGRPTLLPANTAATEAEVEQMRNVAGFSDAQRLYALHLPFEGNREWNWALRGMNDQQLLAAAELARRLSLYDRTINTAERTKQLYNFSLRYLTPFREAIEYGARSNQLDVNWVYGLIRQESRFLADARSNVGATGLMQLMPTTAQFVARKIGISSFSALELTDVNTNIRLGTKYLSMIYEKFNQSAILATASYNAGPRRALQWQTALPGRREGAIFTENIPFEETRNYVKSVLSNAIYYAILLDGSTPSLKERLGYISPPLATVPLNIP